MAIWILANVGQRDLYVDGKAPETPKKGGTTSSPDKLSLRELGEKILRDYPSYQSRLSAPMLEATIQYVLARSSKTHTALILFATNQEDPDYRVNDTMNTGKVLAQWLPTRFPNLDIKPPYEVGGNPQDHDLMLTEYQRLIPRRGDVGRKDEVHVEISGGTPACNMALMLIATRRFRERCHQLHVSEKGAVRDLGLGAGLLNSYRLETAERMLDGYDFSGVADLFPDDEAGLLAEYAVKRGNLDFAAAQNILCNLELRSGEEQWTDLRQETCTLEQDNAAGENATMAELYWQIRLKMDRGEYADAISRIYSLYDRFLKIFICRRFGVVTQAQSGENADRQFNDSLKLKWPLLYDAVRLAVMRELGVPNLYSLKVVRLALNSLIKAAADNAVRLGLQESKDELNEISGIAVSVESLFRLRNLYIHQIKGVSLNAIRDALKEASEGEALKRILQYIRSLLVIARVEGFMDQGTCPENPFDRLRNTIRRVIRAACTAEVGFME